MRNWRKAAISAGVVALGAATVFVTTKLVAEPSTKEVGRAGNGNRATTASSAERRPGELLRRGMVKVEDQSGRPGVKSKDFTETVEGIDADKNGIRDDIQIYIEATYKILPQRAGMLQYTRAAENFMLRAKNLDELKEYWPAYAKSADCLKSLFGDSWVKEAGEIQAQMMNTPPRIEAYIETRRMSKNNIWRLYSGDKPCE
ncbi:hypothetical protein [Cupriavidus sp. USMAA2-4]|uniref:hypothetical protein n=1 Tax=Cupriavidus sp. USMAA2-4 TaxID=876364 RepID=UPI0012F50079|nr:hypothetical protein [Cupriavidus sp. USMAA2-4]